MLTIETLSGAGGVAKSTLVYSLACHWSKDGARVAVYDADESKQLTDAYNLQENVGFDLLPFIPTDEYDILIIDNAPSTKTPRHKADVILYPMLPHRKSIRALERSMRMINTNKVVFVSTRCDMRVNADRENDAILRQRYNALRMTEKSFYKRIIESGGNFLDYKKDNAYYAVKNEVALIAQRIEEFI